MNSKISTIQGVSDTAFWVASYRAIESEKRNALFHDPLAGLLVGEHGKRISKSMAPIARYAYWSVTIRTCLIDELILKYINQGYQTIINLGAGLDTRPYRLPLQPEIQWLEADYPEIIALKNEKLGNHTPKCRLERIGLNLSNRGERKKLFAELNQRAGRALILTEGVIPYLSEDAVEDLASDIRDQPNFKLWISEYYAPEVYPRYQSERFRNLLGDSPFRFFPQDWFSFFEDCGWRQKEKKYLYDEAARYKRKFPLPWWASILRLIFGEERIVRNVRRYSAYVVFEKMSSEIKNEQTEEGKILTKD